MTKISTPTFFIVSILSLSFGLFYSYIKNTKTEKPSVRQQHDKTILENDERVTEIHSHTTWYGDTMYVENDTTFIKRK